MIDLDEIKSRINPAYANTPGTESYERRLLIEEIERLQTATPGTAGNERLQQAGTMSAGTLVHWADGFLPDPGVPIFVLPGHLTANCPSCENRGRTIDQADESCCDHCIHQGPARKDLFSPKGT